jgi:ribulose bisphosphate carboxylase small subunit
MNTTDARDDYRHILTQLLPMYRSTQNRDLMHLSSNFQQVGHIAHGWYMRCLRGCEALLILDEVGYSEEAAPLRRSVIEHVTALKWLASEGNQINDTLARGHSIQTEYIRKIVEEAKWTSVDLVQLDEIISEINTEACSKGNDQYLHHKQRTIAFDDVHSFVGSVAESAKSHPTYESAMSYVAIPDQTMMDEPRKYLNQVPFAAAQLLEATLTFRLVFAAPPWRETLTELLGQFYSITGRVREQDGLVKVDWPTINIP